MIKYVLNLYHVLFCFDFAKCRDCVITLWSINDVSATLWSINDVSAILTRSSLQNTGRQIFF